MVGCLNPLIGSNEPRYGGERFIPTSKAYDKKYSALFRQCAEKLNFTEFVREGIYIFLSGPCFESIAEARMLKSLGADAVGMSTVPEVSGVSNIESQLVLHSSYQESELYLERVR